MIENLQKDFNKLNDWYTMNELYISSEKTLHIDIAVPKMNIKEELHIVKHYGDCKNLNVKQSIKECNTKCKLLEKKKSALYLGVKIDQHWNFKTHILTIINKLRQILPKIYKIRNILSEKNKLIIYDAWIGSILRYGIEIYGFATDYLIQRLQKTQNKVLKVMFNNGTKLTTKEIYNKYEILNITQLRDFIVIINNYQSIDLKIGRNRNMNIDNIRSNKPLYTLPRWNNKYGKRNKQYYLPDIFNKLPRNMLNIEKRKELKKKLKDILLKNN